MVDASKMVFQPLECQVVPDPTIDLRIYAFQVGANPVNHLGWFDFLYAKYFILTYINPYWNLSINCISMEQPYSYDVFLGTSQHV